MSGIPCFSGSHAPFSSALWDPVSILDLITHLHSDSRSTSVHILCQFQDKFVDTARMYYRRSHRALDFVPMYLAPKLHLVVYGQPIRFDPEAPIAEERARICKYLQEEITRMAEALPEHTVIPYRNIPKIQLN